MKSLLQCQDIAFHTGQRLLFSGLDLSIGEGARMGLSGRNGCGKSTLLAIMAGRLAPAAGAIVRRKGLGLSVIEQFLPMPLRACGLRQAIMEPLPEAERPVAGYRADILLEEMGFCLDEADRPAGLLSGGEINRLMLARALINMPDLLLLDEPTNHLDLETQIFFEDYLQNRLTCAFLVISHDRAFLDKVTHQTVFLRDRRAYTFSLPYSQAKEKLLAADIAAAEARKAEEREIERLRKSATRLAEWGKTFNNMKFARRAKSMQRRVAALETERTFVSRDQAAGLRLETEQARGRLLLQIDDLTIAAGERPLFRATGLYVRPGERIALFGANGCGKTTFLKILHAAGTTGASPHIRFSPQCRIAYYDQSLAGVAPEETLFSAVHDRSGLGDKASRHALIEAGFDYDRHMQRVDTLSGGERARLVFMLIRLERPSLLILDEPTNHIDIDGREALEQEILDSQAAVICVSHDRRFIDTVAARYWLVRNGRLQQIDDPEIYYDGLQRPAPARAAMRMPAGAKEIKDGLDPLLPDDPDSLLAELLALEEKLAADRARKPDRQKPLLQAQWAARIGAIYKRLEGAA